MIVIKWKKFLVGLSLILTFCVLAVGVPTVVVASTPAPKYVVVIDAGHGGIDGGVIGTKTKIKESELNLIIAFKVKANLEKAGIGVVMTRNSSEAMAMLTKKQEDMLKRKEKILKAKPNCVVSIHQNKFSMPNRRGAQSFFYGDNSLANSLQKELNDKINIPTLNKSFSALKGDYYILSCTQFPSAIVECGFLSNPFDEALLITNEYQDKMANVICNGIINYLFS